MSVTKRISIIFGLAFTWLMAVTMIQVQPARALDFTISGPVTTTNGGETLSDGDTITITQSGSISTTGRVAFGLFGPAANNILTNLGSISTTGNDAHAMYARGANSSLINSGTINTLGAAARGLIAMGANSSLINSGTINTRGVNAQGMFANGADSTLINLGSISTTGPGADGMDARGANSTLTNSGTINTIGRGAFGMAARGANSTLINSGKISTTGRGARGMVAIGANSTLINLGSISTTGRSARGMYARAANSSLINRGSISTTGSTAYGMYARGDNGTLINLGSISTTGRATFGMYARGDNSTLINSGTIATTGKFADGMFARGANNTLINSGKIATTGESAYGMYAEGNGSTIKNEGTVSASGLNSFAIRVDGTGSTVELNDGSVIIGGIEFFQNDTRLIVGKRHSINHTFTTNAPATVNTTNAFAVKKGLQVVVVDKGSLALQGAQDEVLVDLVNGISQAIGSRQAVRRHPAVNGVHEFIRDGSAAVWVKAFGSSRNVKASNQFEKTDVNLRGLVSGIDGMAWNGLHLGAFFGGARAEAASNDSDSFFGGVYASKIIGRTNVQFVTTAGYMNNENIRTISSNTVSTGIETATIEHKGKFISPELTLTSPLWAGAQRLEKSFKVQYAGLYLDDATETGTTAPLSWDTRNIHVWIARAKLARPNEKTLDNGGIYRTAFYTGIEGRAQKGNNDLTGTLLGQNITLNLGENKNIAAAFAGAELELYSTGGMSLFAKAEGQFESDGTRRISGNAGVKFRF